MKSRERRGGVGEKTKAYRMTSVLERGEGRGG